MTTAICVFCGNFKQGAFVPCPVCDRIPLERIDAVRSLILTDHYFTSDQLSGFGSKLKLGEHPEIDPELEQATSMQIDESMLETLARYSDPAHREYCRKRERNIILAIMAVMVAGIAWILYRFAVS